MDPGVIEECRRKTKTAQEEVEVIMLSEHILALRDLIHTERTQISRSQSS